jgi:hypothetical protein
LSSRCIYTALFGNYEELSEQDFLGQENYKLICFSDIPRESATWEVRIVPRVLAEDGQRSSRFPKIRPDIFLPEFNESIYIDNSVKLFDDPFSYLGNSSEPFHIFRHSFHPHLFREFQEVFARELDNSFRLLEQFSHYRLDSQKMSEIPVLWGGMLYRKHNAPDVIRFGQDWWLHVTRYSRRDQLALAYLANKNLRLFNVINGDNHESNFHKWPVSKRTGSSSELWRIDLQGEKNALFGKGRFHAKRYRLKILFRRLLRFR